MYGNGEKTKFECWYFKIVFSCPNYIFHHTMIIVICVKLNLIQISHWHYSIEMKKNELLKKCKMDLFWKNRRVSTLSYKNLARINIF